MTENKEQKQNISTLSEEEIGTLFKKLGEKVGSQFAPKEVNILICGYTGSGKSSLARAILGDVVPKTAVGEKGVPTTMVYCPYENKDKTVCIWDSKGMELGETQDQFMQTTKDFIHKMQVEEKDVDKHIHLFWYTIQGPNARVTECDIHLLKNIFPKHTYVLITKADITKPSQKTALKDVLLKEGIQEDHIVFTSDSESGSIGCQELIDKSLKELPDAYRDAFIMAQIIDIDKKIQAVKNKNVKARRIIAVAAAAAAIEGGANPLPIADAALITPTQLGMLAGMAVLYGLSWEELKPAFMPIVVQTIGKIATTSLSKLIPVIGQFVNAGVAASLTWGLGVFCKNYMEKCAIAKIKLEPLPPFIFDKDIINLLFKLGKEEKESNEQENSETSSK